MQRKNGFSKGKKWEFFLPSYEGGTSDCHLNQDILSADKKTLRLYKFYKETFGYLTYTNAAKHIFNACI